MKHVLLLLLLAFLSNVGSSQVQTSAPDANLPPSRIIRYNGSAQAAAAQPIRVHVAAFADATDATPLWAEDHDVQVGTDGRYSILLGSNTEGGVPVEIFAAESARWLSILVDGDTAPTRSLLVSVPYALKAVEAERIAGRSGAELVTEADVARLVRETLDRDRAHRLAKSAPEPSSAPGADSPATDFTDTNGTEVLLVTQNGGGLAINAIALSNIAVRGVSNAVGVGAVQGENSAVGGYGVNGVSTAVTGTSFGVIGSSASDTGRGVRGVATHTSGTTIGVQGQVFSPNGAAIQGDNSATTGIALGVRGVTNSSAGKALAGLALAATGASTAIDGQNASNAGTAIFANATSASGSTFGLLARVNSPNGTAARFESSSAAATATLFSGISNNVQRFIVKADGHLIAANVFTDGIAIEGNSTLVGDHFGYGVVGSTKSDKGAGVIGTTTATGNALSSGVQGYVTGTAGVGVWGEATHAADGSTPIGIYGVVNGVDAIGGKFENKNASGKVASFVSNGAEVSYVDQTGFRGSGINVSGAGNFDRLFVTNTSGFNFAITGAGADAASGKGGIEGNGGDGTAGDGGIGLRGVGGDAINAGQGGVGVHALGGSALTLGPGGIGVLSVGGSGNGANAGGIGVHATGGSNLTASGIGGVGLFAQGGNGATLGGAGISTTGGNDSSGLIAFGTGSGLGVVGTGGSNNAIGVRGFGGGTTGIGVSGTGGSTNGIGVRGFGGGDGIGVRGDGNGTGHGVFGLGGPGGGLGVFAVGGASGSTGVYGLGVGSGTGVNGEGGSTSGTGVVGAGGLPNGFGISGSGAGTGAGVLGSGGSSNGIGVHGVGGGNGPGIKGDGGFSNGQGILGVGGGSGVGVEAIGGVSGGYGVEALGTNGFPAIHGTGGSPNGVGIQGIGGATNGSGMQGFGAGSGPGVQGFGGTTGDGVIGVGGGSGGIGVRGTGSAAGATGMLGQGGAAGIGVQGTSGLNGVGVAGVGLGASGIGGSFRNSFADTSQALIVRNAADSNTTFSVQSNGFVSALAFSGDGTNLTNLQALNFTGTLSAANGGTGSSTAQDDRVMVGNGASWQQRILPDCDGSSQKLLYDTATNVFSCATEAGTSSVQRPNTKRWSYIAANGAGNFTATGDAVTLSGGTGTLGPSASTPASTQLPTAAVLNDFNAVNGNLVYSNSANQTLFQAKVAMSGTTSIRVWAIIASTTPATIVTTSMPAVNFAGFRYDTSAGDSNWQCVTNDAGLAGTVQDSGVAPSGSAFDELQVTTTTTSAVFSIDGVQVCSINTNVPVSGADFRYNASVTALSASARSLFVAWIYEESD